jgi:glycosyltransferase involved in cell wall biosynthesis
MNIVFIIDHLRPDGTQAVLVQLVAGLASRGHTQTIICLNNSWDQDIVARLISVGAEVRIIGKFSLASGYGVLSLLHCFKKKQFDVAITFLHVSDVLGRVLAKWASIPRIVSSLRARNVNYSRLQRWLARVTINVADAIIINTGQTRDFAILEEGAQPNRIHVIPNGVSVDIFAHPINQELLREKLDLPKTGWLLGTVGRLTRQKGIDILLQALSLIRKPDFNLVILGTGEDEVSLRAFAVKLGLESRVYFAGYRRDLPTLLGAMDLYVHPARFEGMPNALLEAMAAACAIVATAVDGNRELIEDGKHGWLVPSENPSELARAIEEALSDPKEARLRGAMACVRAREEFSVESMVAAWEAVLTAEKSTSTRKESSCLYAE